MHFINFILPNIGNWLFKDDTIYKPETSTKYSTKHNNNPYDYLSSLNNLKAHVATCQHRFTCE